ncbi:MAG: SCO1664 family protein [Actinomycetales bacterium]
MSEILDKGKLEVIGRLVDASNATLFGEISLDGHTKRVIYKPIAGERPLWDFPDGNLASREYAAYLISDFGEFNLVPRTLLRDGPFGIGSVQEWIEIDEEIDVIEIAQSNDRAIRSMALFDVIVNNTDRKFGHILIDKNSKIYGCDHGVTFHVDFKLRTVIWQFAGLSLKSEEKDQLKKVLHGIFQGELDLRELLTSEEIEALTSRIENLLTSESFPLPSEEWPAVSWPPG